MIAKHKPHIQAAADALAHLVYAHSPTEVQTLAEKGSKSAHAIATRFKAWLYRHHMGVEIGLITAAFGFVLFSIFWHRQLNLGFANISSCNSKIVILPDLHRVTDDGGYNVSFENTLSIGNLDLLSRQFCVTPRVVQPPHTEEALRFSPLGLGLIEHKVLVKVPSYPKLNTGVISNKVSTYGELVLPLESQDTIFSYTITANNKSEVCHNTMHEVICSVKNLELKQAMTYPAEITRMHNNQKVEAVFEGELLTIDPVIVSTSVPKSDETIYTNISTIEVETNKELATYEDIRLYRLDAGTVEEVEITVQHEGHKLVIHASKALARRATFKLVIGNVKSQDGGQLDQPYELTFHTSGGPVVTGINIGRQRVSLGSVLSISFDQALSTQQNPQALVSLSAGGSEVPFSARIVGNKIHMTPASLARCTSYRIGVTPDVKNPMGASGDSAWAYNFRTTCAEVSVIGHSVKGRAIYAYRFGSGPSNIVFVGGMHGSEASSYYTLNAWIQELELSPERIPAHRSIIVIPNSNPDGLAIRQRTNSNGVDLNRNFPASDWTSGVYMPGPTFAPNGGGSAPLSEPESRALASYIQSVNPRLVLTYHAVAAVVIGNGSGDSESLAALYASKSRYSVSSDSHADEIFSYATTGEFEDWLHDKLAIPAILVELATMSGNELTRNQAAMWAIAELP